MIISRVWAMPSKYTFTIKPIKELLNNYIKDNQIWIDPYANDNSPATITNDLNPNCKTKYHLDALSFGQLLEDDKYDGVLYDPPYSLRQIMECYDGFGLDVNKKFATTKFYSEAKNIFSKKIKLGGLAISFGWNSIGFGKKRGFEIIEILLISHGRLHNDTIVTVEKRIKHQQELF